MLAECLEGLHIRPGDWYIDGTFGAGGHTQAILRAGGSVLAVDRDPNVKAYLEGLEVPKSRELRFAEGDFRHLDRYARDAGVERVSGVLLDLGVSSMQLDEAERGFAFRRSGPLDMRMGGEGRSAAEVVNGTPAEDLAAILFKYGEERHSRRIARRIAEVRDASPIETTGELADIVGSAYPPGRRREHPARRTFQALRIFVNDELGALSSALEAAERVLSPGGRLVVLSYHSLEDRIVKHTLRERDAWQPITKRPLTASPEEVEANQRARAAKLRVGERVDTSSRSTSSSTQRSAETPS